MRSEKWAEPWAGVGSLHFSSKFGGELLEEGEVAGVRVERSEQIPNVLKAERTDPMATQSRRVEGKRETEADT